MTKLWAAVQEVGYGLLKLTKSTGKASWIAGTAFLILVVPLIIEMDREQQMVEFEQGSQQALTGAPGGAPAAGGAAPALAK